MAIEPKPSVTTIRYPMKVTVFRQGQIVVQHHPRYQAIVRLPGVREPFRCCGQHQKATAAKRCGERYARLLMKRKAEQA